MDEKQRQMDLLGGKLLGETEISKKENLIEKFINFCNLDNNLSLRELTTKFEEDFALMYKGKMNDSKIEPTVMVIDYSRS